MPQREVLVAFRKEMNSSFLPVAGHWNGNWRKASLALTQGFSLIASGLSHEVCGGGNLIRFLWIFHLKHFSLFLTHLHPQKKKKVMATKPVSQANRCSILTLLSPLLLFYVVYLFTLSDPHIAMKKWDCTRSGGNLKKQRHPANITQPLSRSTH